MIVHPIEPVFNENSKILILGTFPSVKSREYGFYYGHPQNRFWKVIARVFNSETPITIEDKKQFLLDNRIALWDVINSCEITGSADSSIKNVVPNDLTELLNTAHIKRIFLNGKTAEKLYNKYIKCQNNIDSVVLPSTSPANAVWSEDKLFEAWSNEIRQIY